VGRPTALTTTTTTTRRCLPHFNLAVQTLPVVDPYVSHLSTCAILSAAEYLASRGPENVTADEIVRHVRPEGRAAVPDNVKAELLTRIKAFILQL
jgi:hypothetical protein